MIGSCVTLRLYFLSLFPIGQFPYPSLPSDWTSLASDELILVKYSRARAGLKIEPYIKQALQPGWASLLPAARQSRSVEGGNRQQPYHSRRPRSSSFSYKCCSVASCSLPGQAFRVYQAVTNFLPSLLTWFLFSVEAFSFPAAEHLGFK